jgi:5-methylcytosine-specific restriction endonuclease McrA
MPRKDLAKRKEYAAEHYKKNISFFNRYSAEWRKKNPEKAKEIQRKYRAVNHERVLASNKKWRDGNKEKQSASSKRWAILNNSKIREYSRKRRNSKFEAEGFHTQGEWDLLKVQYGFMCPSCKKKEPEIKLTEDHIIPLSKGGSDYIENIQPLCGNCNCKKATKILKYE